jgi:uncharacterized protein YjbI with pentapeptide repeats
MKLLTWIAGLMLVFVCWVIPAQAASPSAVTQLLETRSCVGCDLRRADLRDADLRGVNLRQANLQRANLRGAKLFGVELQAANLKGADLTDTDLLNVDATQANFKGAKLTGSLDQLKLCKTIAPDGKLTNRDCQPAR